MADVELRGVVKRYGEVTAVKGVSLEVQQGELITLLGSSGCGKTTVLRMITGFLTPDEGEVVIRGQVVNDLPPHHRDTAMVYQSYALFPHMTVLENVAFGLQMRRVPRGDIKRRVERVLGMVHLEGYERRYPAQLSGGQQQRVALARALVVRPSVLLLDEPLSNLDAKLREQVRTEIRQLQREVGITTIFVTHDQVEALAMSDRIAVMNHGKIEQIGTPDEIYERPATKFVMDFVGRANLFDVEVVGTEGDLTVARAGDGTLIRVCNTLRCGPGERLTVGIRPERIASVANAANGAMNNFAATVHTVSYLGETLDYQVSLPTGVLLTVVEPNRSGRRLVPGMQTTVSFAASDCVSMRM
jgi:putative spermidine/putrescine transport system ATP-binding protein